MNVSVHIEPDSPLLELLARRVAELVSNTPPAASGWLSLKSAALFLDVSEQALRARVKRGEVPVYSRDGRLYFAHDELERYVREGYTG